MTAMMQFLPDFKLSTLALFLKFQNADFMIQETNL